MIKETNIQANGIWANISFNTFRVNRMKKKGA